MTAAAATGPDKGPRPASSTPARRPSTSQASASCSGLDDLRDGIGGTRGGVATQLLVHLHKTLPHLITQRGLVQPAQGFLGQSLGWYGPNDGAGLIGAVIGAIIVLAVYGALRRRA